MDNHNGGVHPTTCLPQTNTFITRQPLPEPWVVFILIVNTVDDRPFHHPVSSELGSAVICLPMAPAKIHHSTGLFVCARVHLPPCLAWRCKNPFGPVTQSGLQHNHTAADRTHSRAPIPYSYQTIFFDPNFGGGLFVFAICRYKCMHTHLHSHSDSAAPLCKLTQFRQRLKRVQTCKQSRATITEEKKA